MSDGRAMRRAAAAHRRGSASGCARLELAKEVPELLVVWADLIVAQLVEERIDQPVVWHEGGEVHRA